MEERKTQTFILHLNSGEISQIGYIYNLTINIPDAKFYKHFKVYVKDFFVVRTAIPSTDILFKLRTNTIRLVNAFDTTTIALNNQLNVSTQIAIVHNAFPMIINTLTDIGFEIANLNGRHSFWLESDTGLASATSTLPWNATLVFIGTN